MIRNALEFIATPSTARTLCILFALGLAPYLLLSAIAENLAK